MSPRVCFFVFPCVLDRGLNKSYADSLAQLATSVLDPDDTGQIEVEQVLSAITTKTPEQILLHSN